MQDSDQIEQRFQAAALRVCKRLALLDLEDQNPGGLFIFGGADEVYPPDHPIVAIERRIRARGTDAVRELLRSEPFRDVIVELSAHNRLDLAIEALCIRPAWLDLFSAGERSIAANRLTDAMLFKSAGAIAPPSDGGFDRTLAWLDEHLRHVEEDDWGNGSCDEIAEYARELNETGYFRTSFAQRRHYRSCANCAREFARLDPIVSASDRSYFDRCKKILKILIACLDVSEERAARLGPSQAHPAGWDLTEALAWRAMVCAEYASDHLPAVEQYKRAGADHADGDFHQFVSSLLPDEVFAFYFAHESRRFVLNLQYEAFRDDSKMYLATDGDLSSVPGILEALPSNDFTVWTRLMTGRNLQCDGEGVIDGLNLFHMLIETAQTKARTRNEASTLVVRPQQGPDLEEMIRRLLDGVEHIDMAQGPIIAAIQDLLKAIEHAPSRYKAEESLRAAMKDDIYSSLCPLARATRRSLPSTAGATRILRLPA